jgi:hypothetical protein
MRYIFYFLFFVLIGGVGISGCGNGNQFADKIHVLDSLSVEIEKLQDSIMLTDTMPYKNAHKTIEKNIKAIQQQLKDTVSPEEARFLSDYKMIRKALGNFSGKLYALKNELNYTQTQLYNLSRDLNRGYIEASKAEEYFSIEVTSAQAVIEDGWSTLQNNPVYLKMFEEINPKVNEFINAHHIAQEN